MALRCNNFNRSICFHAGLPLDLIGSTPLLDWSNSEQVSRAYFAPIRFHLSSLAHVSLLVLWGADALFFPCAQLGPTVQRCREIRAWLDQNGQHISAWIVLDDLPLTDEDPTFFQGYIYSRGSCGSIYYPANCLQTIPDLDLRVSTHDLQPQWRHNQHVFYIPPPLQGGTCTWTARRGSLPPTSTKPRPCSPRSCPQRRAGQMRRETLECGGTVWPVCQMGINGTDCPTSPTPHRRLCDGARWRNRRWRRQRLRIVIPTARRTPRTGRLASGSDSPPAEPAAAAWQLAVRGAAPSCHCRPQPSPGRFMSGAARPLLLQPPAVIRAQAATCAVGWG
jgi:hypothetical protein